MIMRISFTTLTLLLALLATPFASHAGEFSSDLGGKVVDASGQAVPGAVMLVEYVGIGRITRHVANAKGRWHAPGLRSDLIYRVSCYAPGQTSPEATFTGNVDLGRSHTRNCVVGKLDESSPKWLSSWQWKQP